MADLWALKGLIEEGTYTFALNLQFLSVGFFFDQ